MTHAMRLIWPLTMVCFISGCSAFGVVYGPEGDDFPRDLDWTEIVKSGESIRVTTVNQRVIEGKAVGVWADSLRVEAERRGFLGRKEPTEIVMIGAEEDILSIEVLRFSIIKTSILIVAIAVPFVIYGMTTDGIWGGYSSPVGG